MARERKKSDFGSYLAELIKKAGMTQFEFFSEVGITKPYFYDILGGRANPPPRETLERMMDVLEKHLPQDEIHRTEFINRAAICRGEIPCDKKWDRLESYGPKFVENIIQATARDILTESMHRLEAAGYRIVMHVHDEVVIEAPADTSLETICETMGQAPQWASGLLLRADGYVADFYKKD